MKRTTTAVIFILCILLSSCGVSYRQTAERPADIQNMECNQEISIENCENISTETIGLLPAENGLNNEEILPQKNNSGEQGFLPFRY